MCLSDVLIRGQTRVPCYLNSAYAVTPSNDSAQLRALYPPGGRNVFPRNGEAQSLQGLLR